MGRTVLRGKEKHTWGTGGPGYTLKAEFNFDHTREASYPLDRDPNSAGSQFFIVTTDSAFLDRQYTVFGEVTDGMETADAIVKLEKDGNDCPLQDVKMTKVTVT